MKLHRTTLAVACVALATGISLPAFADARHEAVETLVALGYPAPQEGELVHIPPTMADLDASDLHPETKRVIRRGYDLFTDTQQLRGENVFNDMNCSSCHLGEGRQPFSAPIWPAAVLLPNFRGKNQHVNNLEERIAGCFAYSMNGTPPAYGSDDMLALSAYHQWLARGWPCIPTSRSMAVVFRPPSVPRSSATRAVSRAIWSTAPFVTPRMAPVTSRTASMSFRQPGGWLQQLGAGIVRTFTAAGFIQNNMPLGQPNSLSDQEAWDIAYYMVQQERPQDPRYTGDVAETLERFGPTFHRHSHYGQRREHDGHRLADHANWGEKGDEIKPWNIGVPRFETLAD